MTNLEKLIDDKELLLKILSVGGLAAIKGVVNVCEGTLCRDCDFDVVKTGKNCNQNRKAWLEAEYIEKPHTCPCCESNDVEVECSVPAGRTELATRVRCKDCGMQTGWHDSKNEALAIWNRRL